MGTESASGFGKNVAWCAARSSQWAACFGWELEFGVREMGWFEVPREQIAGLVVLFLVETVEPRGVGSGSGIGIGAAKERDGESGLSEWHRGGPV